MGTFPKEEFLKDLNSLGTLNWTLSELSSSVNFMDISFYINQKTGHLDYQPYAKKLNLYLYIPAHSAHALGVLKSMIHGILWRYWKYSSQPIFYKTNAKNLFSRLIIRGYPYSILKK